MLGIIKTMSEDTTNMIAAAAVGSIFTLIVQAIIVRSKRRYVKKTVNLFLVEIIEPICEKIIVEIPRVKDAISKYSSKDVTLGMHPSFNSKVLTSFSLEDLQPIFKGNLEHIIDIIGILNNLEKRLPHIYFSEFVEETYSHIEKNFEKYKSRYSTKSEHFYKCPEIKNLRNRTSTNLNHVQEIIDELKDIISILKIKYPAWRKYLRVYVGRVGS